MKKKILAVGLVGLLTTMSLTGCTAGLRYDNADKYTIGGASLSETVTALNVNWISGNVNVVYDDVTKVSFSETSTGTLTEKTSMYYWLDGTVLRIQYAQSTHGCSGGNYPSKALTITLPYGLELVDAEIFTVSADIDIDGLTAQEIQINSVSGEIDGTVYTAQDLEVDSVSGNVNVYISSAQDVDVSSVSGNVALTMETAPSTGEADSVSGNITLYVNSDEGYKVSYETVSGRFSAELAGTLQGKTWTYGNGASVWSVSTTSGDIQMKPGVFND